MTTVKPDALRPGMFFDHMKYLRICKKYIITNRTGQGFGAYNKMERRLSELRQPDCAMEHI